jgi:hypothetical protein
VITYADTHETNIYDNGSRIDLYSDLFNLDVLNVMAMNPNENVFMTQRDVVRADDTAEFRLLMDFPETFTTTGILTIDFPEKDIKGNTGGFTLTLSEKKVC